MAPKFKFTKDEIVNSALNIARQDGFESITARAVAQKLHSSPKVIFGTFENMEQLQKEVFFSANKMYQNYIAKALLDNTMPPLKASGLAYINFAKQEKNLFKLLFMRDTTKNDISQPDKNLNSLYDLIQKNTGLDRQQAVVFHQELWFFVHGIATMCATSFIDWDNQYISQCLTDCYIGLKLKFCGEDKK